MFWCYFKVEQIRGNVVWSANGRRGGFARLGADSKALRLASLICCVGEAILMPFTVKSNFLGHVARDIDTSTYKSWNFQGRYIRKRIKVCGWFVGSLEHNDEGTMGGKMEELCLARDDGRIKSWPHSKPVLTSEILNRHSIWPVVIGEEEFEKLSNKDHRVQTRTCWISQH